MRVVRPYLIMIFDYGNVHAKWSTSRKCLKNNFLIKIRKNEFGEFAKKISGVCL